MEKQQLLLEAFAAILVLFLVGNVSSNAIRQKDQDTLVDNQGLYNASDFVVILNDTNFKSNVYDSQKAWLVEFYNSWCGFCHRFAPIWKSLAKNIYTWKDIVRIAVIDCANDDNNPLCREYEIMAYPTIKFFPVNSKKDFLGLLFKNDNDETMIMQGLIDQLEKEQQEQRGGSTWPNIVPYRGTEIDGFWNRAPSILQYEFLIFEEPKAYLGAEVILDLHKLESIRIRRVSSDNEFLTITNKITNFPSLIVLDRNNSRASLKINTNTKEGIKEVILEFLNLKGINTIIKEDDSVEKVYEHHTAASHKKQEIEITESNNSRDKLYQLDLESTLRYSLNNEIPLSAKIDGEKFQVLKAYLKALANYFPVYMPKAKVYLYVLKEIVESRSNISGKDFKMQVREKENGFMPVYSAPKTWIGCKGSSPIFRGYPCGLWTMFHTLSVAATEESDTSLNNSEYSSILTVIHGYVKNFFGCADCSEHFQEMSKRRKLFEVRNGDETILWLWRAHNEVNERLAGDEAGDPQHKKVQYPSAKNCPKCRLSNGQWDEQEVLRYLKIKYGKSNIDFEGINTELLHHEKKNSVLNAGVSYRKLGWDFTIFDISICVILYITSAAILTLVCIKFAFKRTSKKKISLQTLLGS